MSGRGIELAQPIPGYEVLELIGSGGMSSVYKARQKELDRMVALKVIRRDQIDPGLALERLTKEARVLSRLDHPGIVRSIDFGTAGDLVYFVMELVEGRSCKQLLIEREKLALREVVIIGQRIASALGYAAAHGVIHRDVKPGNILLGRDGSVKLTDFGLARATRDRSLTQDGITVGTPQYMSPEQVKSPRRVDLRSDLYSLGATLYHLSTGEPPAYGDTVGEILHKVLYTSPLPPEQIEPALPAVFSRVLARLLAKDPRRRYASAIELVADLEKVKDAAASAGDDPTVGLSWQESAAPPPPRWRLRLLAAAAVGVVALAGSLLLDGGGRDPDGAATARSDADEFLAELGQQFESGALPPARALARVARFESEGGLSATAKMTCIELGERASARLDQEIAAVARGAQGAADRVLARGDFEGAQREFEATLARELDAVLPRELLDALAERGHDRREIESARSREHGFRLDQLAERLRGEMHRALLDSREELRIAVETALDDGRLAEAREILGEHAQVERRSAADAARAEMAAAGVPIAAGTSDEELERGWPDLVRSELEREPAESAVEAWNEVLAGEIRLRQRELTAALGRSFERDLAAARAGEPVDPDARRAEFEREHGARLRALAEVGGTPAELEKSWSDHREAVARIQRERAAERAAEALARLLEPDDGGAGIVDLLGRRETAAARAAIAAHEELDPADSRAWTGAAQDLDLVFETVHDGLRRKLGSTVAGLRDRSGIASGGLLAMTPDGAAFLVGDRTLQVRDLALASLEGGLAELPDGPRRLAARWLLGDARDHDALDDALASAPSDRVLDVLRRRRADEKLSAKEKQDLDEAKARTARAALDAALDAADAGAAERAWKELRSLGGTATGRAAAAERTSIEKRIAESWRRVRARAMLAEVFGHATSRELLQDGSFVVEYQFDDPDEGVDFGLSGNAVRIENGRMAFEGGAAGKVTAERDGAAVLPLPLDRRAPCSLRLELFPPPTETGPPHFVALRVGGACAAFYRPVPTVGESFEPQLSAWFGTLDEAKPRFFMPGLTSEPEVGRVQAVGLERGRKHRVELRFAPKSGSASGAAEVWLDGQQVFEASGAMEGDPARDAVELRSLTTLQVDALELRGRLIE